MASHSSSSIGTFVDNSSVSTLTGIDASRESLSTHTYLSNREQLANLLKQPLCEEDRQPAGKLWFRSSGRQRWSTIAASYGSQDPNLSSPFSIELSDESTTCWMSCQAPKRIKELCWLVLELQEHTWTGNLAWIENVDRSEIEHTLSQFHYWLQDCNPYCGESGDLRFEWVQKVSIWQNAGKRQSAPGWADLLKGTAPVTPPKKQHFDENASRPSSDQTRPFMPHAETEPMPARPQLLTADYHTIFTSTLRFAHARSRSVDSTPQSPTRRPRSSSMSTDNSMLAETCKITCLRHNFDSILTLCREIAEPIVTAFTGLTLSEYMSEVKQINEHNDATLLNYPWLYGIYSACKQNKKLDRRPKRDSALGDLSGQAYCDICQKRHSFRIRKGLIMLVAVGKVDQRLWEAIHDGRQYTVSHLYPIANNLNPLHLTMEPNGLNQSRKSCSKSQRVGKCAGHGDGVPKCNMYADVLYRTLHDGEEDSPVGRLREQPTALELAMCAAYWSKPRKPMLDAYGEVGFNKELLYTNSRLRTPSISDSRPISPPAQSPPTFSIEEVV